MDGHGIACQHHVLACLAQWNPNVDDLVARLMAYTWHICITLTVLDSALGGVAGPIYLHAERVPAATVLLESHRPF